MISLASGQTIYLTTFTSPITFDGNVYQSSGIQIKRDSWAVKYTQEVPSMSFTMYSNGSDMYSPTNTVVNFKTLAHQGALDYAYIQMNRVFMNMAGVSMGAVLLFGGRTSQIQIGAMGVQMTAKGDNVLMQQYMPRNTYQLGCIHMLYDAGCTLLQSSFSITQPIGPVPGVFNPTVLFIPWSAAPADPTLYTNGIIAITSGAAMGQTRSIFGATENGISVIYPLYNVPAPGDTMVVSRGCNKTTMACNSFGNLTHYRGFPFIPQVETAY